MPIISPTSPGKVTDPESIEQGAIVNIDMLTGGIIVGGGVNNILCTYSGDKDIGDVILGTTTIEAADELTFRTVNRVGLVVTADATEGTYTALHWGRYTIPDDAANPLNGIFPSTGTYYLDSGDISDSFDIEDDTILQVGHVLCGNILFWRPELYLRASICINDEDKTVYIKGNLEDD